MVIVPPSGSSVQRMDKDGTSSVPSGIIPGWRPNDVSPATILNDRLVVQTSGPHTIAVSIRSNGIASGGWQSATVLHNGVSIGTMEWQGSTGVRTVTTSRTLAVGDTIWVEAWSNIVGEADSWVQITPA